MARGLSVFVNIGARLGPSLNSAATAAERRMAQMSRKFKVLGAEMKASLKGAEEAQSRARGALFDGVAMGYAGSRAIKPFVEFEDALVRMGNTAEVHGSRLEAAGRQIVATGQRYALGGSEAIVGANDYVAAGMKLSQAMAALDPTLKLAKTAGVEVGEASQSGIALMQNLGVEARQLGAAFDIMAKAGKEGRFEINDMARAFPGLTSRAKALGMNGLDGVQRMSALLQITRTNARDAEEGENNLLNFLDKLTGKETSDYFGKYDVDINKIYKRAMARGTDFVDEMIAETDRLTKGGTDMSVMSKIFVDRQARQAALALVTRRKELERIRKVSGQGAGTLTADFERISRTSKFGLGRAFAGLERIGIALGKAFGPALGAMLERFASLSERFAVWAEKNPRIVSGIMSVALALTGLKIALAAAGFIFGGFSGRLIRFFGSKLIGLAASGIAGFGVALLNGLVRIGPWLIRGIALLFTPVGLAAAVVGAGAALIYYFRDDIAKAWPAVKQWFVDAFNGVKATILGINWAGVGMRIADSLTFGLASKLPGLISKVNAIGAGVVGAGSRGGSPGKKPPGRARGGSVSAGSPYTVGERGEELFVPNRSGTVVPAHVLADMRRARSGGGFTHNGDINIHGAQDPQATAAAVRRELKRLANGQGALLSD